MFVFYVAVVAALVLGPQVLAKRATPPPTTCTGALAHATTNDMSVPSGAICRVSSSTVNGSVTVAAGAYFEASATRIYGNIQATGALTVFLHDGTYVSGSMLVDTTSQFFLYKTTIAGAVRITNAMAPGFGHVQVCDSTLGQVEIRGSGPDILVGDPNGGCPGNTVQKNLVVSGNTALSEIQISGNHVVGSLTVTGNSGPAAKRVTSNVVQGAVDVSNNALPIVAENNP